MRRPSIQTLEAKAERLARPWFNKSGVCLAEGRDGLECTNVVQYAHLMRRSKSKHLKFSPLNAACLCSAHHVKYDNHWPYMASFMDDLMPGRWEMLVELDRFCTRHGKTLIDRRDCLESYIEFYKGRQDKFIDWHRSGEDYIDIVERAWKEFMW